MLKATAHIVVTSNKRNLPSSNARNIAGCSIEPYYYIHTILHLICVKLYLALVLNNIISCTVLLLAMWHFGIVMVMWFWLSQLKSLAELNHYMINNWNPNHRMTKFKMNPKSPKTSFETPDQREYAQLCQVPLYILLIRTQVQKFQTIQHKVPL